MRPTLPLLILLTACGDGDAAAPTPYVYEAEAPEVSEVAPDEAIAAIEAALAALASIDPEVFAAGYQAASAYFDADGCPSWSDLNGHDRWIDDCTTQSGLEFHGDFIALNIAGFTMEDLYVDDMQRNFGQLNARFPDGQQLYILGDTEVLRTSSRDGRAWAEAFANGDFYWSVGDPWLQDFLFVAVAWQGSSAPGGAWTVDLDGELGRLPGVASALDVQALSLSGDASGCTTPPTGLLRAWTHEGAQELRLTLAGEGAGGCVACGPLEIGGEGAGSACVDLSAWQGAPW